MNKQIVTENLKKARGEWSQEKAAKLIGIKRCTLASYEEGRALPPITLFPKIADVYGIIDWKGFLSDPNFDISNQNATAVPLSLIEQKFNELSQKEKSLAKVLLSLP